jgi:hypothetical protein
MSSYGDDRLTGIVDRIVGDGDRGLALVAKVLGGLRCLIEYVVT